MASNLKNNNNTLDNPILAHLEQDAWNNTQAYFLENESVWRKVAILAIVGIVVVSIFAMYMVNQDKHKVVVFEKDSLGNIQTLGLATTSFSIDNKIIAHQLDQFITDLREVPIDRMVKRRNIDVVHSMVDARIKSSIDQMIVDQYSRIKDANSSISVEVNNIKPIEGGRSWEVRWTEKINGNSADGKQITHWDTTVTFKRANSADPTTQMRNPAGLQITNINPTQDVNDKGQ